MADQVAVTDLVAEAGVDALISEEPVLQIMDKGIAKEYEQRKYQTGDTVSIRIEDQPRMPKQQATINLDPIIQDKIDVTVLQWNDGFNLTAIEEDLQLGGEARVRERILNPRLKNMAVQSALIAYEELVTCPGFFGTPGTVPKTATDWALAQAALKDQLAGNSGLFAIMSNQTMAETAGDLAKAFNPSEDSSVAYMKGMVKMAGNLNFFDTSNIPNHTNGSAVGNGTSGMTLSANPVTGATSVSVSGGTANGTIKKNSLIWFGSTAAGKGYEVQPNTKNTLARLRYFRVTADVLLSAGGAGSIPIFPALIGPENPKQQTISVLPTTAVAAFVGVVGDASATYEQAIVVKKNACAFVGLSLPDLVNCKVSTSDYEGIEVKASMAGDIVNYQNVVRADILVAAKIRQWRHVYRTFTRKLS
jgi:hypothetical protein